MSCVVVCELKYVEQSQTHDASPPGVCTNKQFYLQARSDAGSQGWVGDGGDGGGGGGGPSDGVEGNVCTCMNHLFESTRRASALRPGL